MMTFILWFIRFLVLVVAVAMVRMAFVYWYRRNSTSPLAVLLREKLFFLPSGFWPTPLVDDGPTLTELIEEQDEELDPERQLLKAEKGHSFVFNFVSQTVVGRVSTQRMEQEVQRNNYPWHDVPGERNQFVFVDGNQAFAYYPFGERGRPVWFFLEPEDASGLWEYFKGSDTEPGPARKFGASRQLGTVTFTLFGKTWKMKDIGMNSFRVESGRNLIMKGNGRFAHLVAEQVDGDAVLFFTHIEEGEGYDGVWIGEQADMDFLSDL